MTDLRELGFPSVVNRSQLADLLAERYPDYRWEKVYLLRGRFAQQQRLAKALEKLFPVTRNILSLSPSSISLYVPPPQRFQEF